MWQHIQMGDRLNYSTEQPGLWAPLTGGRVRGGGHWGPLAKAVKVTVWDANSAQCVSERTHGK